jgi:phosphonoacetaldehyde hydrolase
MWSVGESLTGNEVGLSEGAAAALTPGELRGRLRDAEQRLVAAGAHAVIESVTELPATLEQIAARLSRGERP